MENPDMLAFTYRIQKIVRDMKHLPMRGEAEEQKREAVMDALRGVCEQIEREFS